MRGWWNDPGKVYKRIDDWSKLPNSYVNDDGKPNLNNSDADNQNDGRVSVRN